jgi:hypothetical protein
LNLAAGANTLTSVENRRLEAAQKPISGKSSSGRLQLFRRETKPYNRNYSRRRCNRKIWKSAGP